MPSLFEELKTGKIFLHPADLKEEMPDPTGIDGPRLLAWAEVLGRGQMAP